MTNILRVTERENSPSDFFRDVPEQYSADIVTQCLDPANNPPPVTHGLHQQVLSSVSVHVSFDYMKTIKMGGDFSAAQESITHFKETDSSPTESRLRGDQPTGGSRWTPGDIAQTPTSAAEMAWRTKSIRTRVCGRLT